MLKHASLIGLHVIACIAQPVVCLYLFLVVQCVQSSALVVTVALMETEIAPCGLAFCQLWQNIVQLASSCQS